MSATWLTWAVDDPAPGNCGYSALNIACEVEPELRYGQTVHSVWGYFTYINPSAVMEARGNSWGVTIMRNGQVWRHRPRPTFVNWHGGGPAQNIGTDGIEMEGKDEPWTPEQKASLLRVLEETWEWFGWATVALGGPTDRTQNGIRLALLALPHGSLWEHNWFDDTLCPMDRDDWPWLIPELTMALSRKGTTMWSNWGSLGGKALGSPAVASWAEKRLDVFVINLQGELCHKWYTRAHGWQPAGVKWENLGRPQKPLIGSPAAVSWGDHRIDVAAVDKNGEVHHKWYER